MREIDDIEKIIGQYKAYLALEKGLSENTVNSYDDDVTKLLRYAAEEGKTLRSITEADLHEVLAALHEVGIQPRSQARILSGIKSFFHFLVLADYREDEENVLII